MLKRIFFLLAIVSIASFSTVAQVTTSSLTGIVKDANGEPLTGASILATHTPSGTVYKTISNATGRYSILNMRTGGPYEIEISFVGFQTDKIGDVYLNLGEPFNLPSTLTTEANELEKVVVTATGRRNPIMNGNRTGAVTNLGRQQIERMPTITRNINDLTRSTPQSNGASVAGGNYRQNNFTIDGADFNNSFGIGGNLPANGTPISLDALDEISVSITPFDVRQSGFIGSAINAVTRAGTNQFQGSVYRYWRSEKQQGEKVNGAKVNRPPFEFQQIGARVGGAIIKNKLFFFLNYETENQPKQVQNRIAATPELPFGSANPNVARPTRTEMDMISSYLRTNYGYETGPYDNYNTEIKRTKIMGRIDWNINTNHRLTLRYSQVKGGDPSPVSTSTSGSNYSFVANGGRQTNQMLWFKNTNYFQGANFYSTALELNSKIGKISNLFRASYTFQDDSRESDSQVFPLVDILKDGTSFATFGYEPFSYGNLRKVKMYSIVDEISFASGKHSWTAGLQADLSETTNGFQRFGTSYYVFNSWDDFTGGANPVNFAQTYSLSPGFQQAFPKFKFAQFSGYAQDQISLNDRFRLTLGLRLDLPTYPHIPEVQTHPLVNALTFADGININTGVLPRSNVLFSPRVGFNYDVYGDRTLQIRGGSGIFTGKIPFVWIVSQVGDAGMLQITSSSSGQANTPGPFNPSVNAYLPPTPPAAGTAVPNTISAMSPDFKFPQTWKSSIGFDKSLGKNFILTMEAIYNKDLNTAVFKNVNLMNPQPLNVSGYSDNRMIYPSATRDKFINPLTAANAATNPSTPVPNGSALGTQGLNTSYLTNGSKGHYFSYNVKLEKIFSKGFSGFLAYTASVANNLYDGSGDQPLSAWQNTVTVNGSNTPILGAASFVVPHRISAGITYKKEYLKHLATTISLFFDGSSQGRFSYLYTSDFNRDGWGGNDLIYIPANPSEITFVPRTVGSGASAVTFTAQEQSDAFFAFIDQDKYLRKRKGEYATRNGVVMPWRNQIDLRFMQDVFTNIGKDKNTLQFTIDIFNFGNLLNNKWGIQNSPVASGLLVPTNVSSLVPGGAVKPTFQLNTPNNELPTKSYQEVRTISSTYYMQFGIRYLFN